MRTAVAVACEITDSPRVAQIRGLFDLPSEPTSRLSWDVNLPIEEQPWNIGLIVGPSGCGKSTIARSLWPAAYESSRSLTWPSNGAVVDGFPSRLGVKSVVELLCSCGFSSPPSWLKPFRVLSTGQQFRVTLARLIAEAISPELEPCCNCGEEYPRRELEAGHVFCGRCRANPLSIGYESDRVDSPAVRSCGGPHGPGVPPGPVAQAMTRGTSAAVTIPAGSAAQGSPLIVLDEFTSTVDRTVAQIGSAAVAKAVRRHGVQFVAVTCHEDVEEWLQPDWVYRPVEQSFTRRLLRRRPRITLELSRCDPAAWGLFAPHHYMSHTLVHGSKCWLASWRGQPVVFSAWCPFVGSGPPARREHRTVCLPDYQGVGLGNAVSDTLASLWAALRFVARSTTTNPAMIASRMKSPHWRCSRRPSMNTGREKKMLYLKHASSRFTTGFEWIGKPMNRTLARMLLCE